MGGPERWPKYARAHQREVPVVRPDPCGPRRRRPRECLTGAPLRRPRPRNASRKSKGERLRPAEGFRRLQRQTYQRGLKAKGVTELIGSDRWPRDALVLAAYPVDDLDLRRAVTDHHYRFFAVPSFVEFVGTKYRVALVGGPSCIVPFVRCGTLRRVGFFVDAVNAQVTPMVGLRPTVPSGSPPVRRGQKETFATTMISAGRAEVK